MRNIKHEMNSNPNLAEDVLKKEKKDLCLLVVSSTTDRETWVIPLKSMFCHVCLYSLWFWWDDPIWTGGTSVEPAEGSEPINKQSEHIWEIHTSDFCRQPRVLVYGFCDLWKRCEEPSRSCSVTCSMIVHL